MMKTITQYGITTEYAYFLGNQKSFYIQRLDGDVPDKYIYPGDSIKYELDAQLTVLYTQHENSGAASLSNRCSCCNNAQKSGCVRSFGLDEPTP